MTDVKFEPVDKDNMKPIIAEMDKEWDFSKTYGGIGSTISELYFYSKVSSSSDAFIVLVDGEVAGVVAYKVPGRKCIDKGAEINMLYEKCRKDDKFNDMMVDQNTVLDMYHDLYNKSGLKDCGELVLLIFTEAARSKGVGRIVFEKVTGDIKSSGINKMFMYTDTYCNTGFYDHLGAKCIESGKVVCSSDEFTVFLYVVDF